MKCDCRRYLNYTWAEVGDVADCPTCGRVWVLRISMGCPFAGCLRWMPKRWWRR